MARNSENVITHGLSGKLGNLCLQRNGIVRSRPDVSQRRWSKRQLEHLQRIEEAKAYAREVKDDPALSEPYLRVMKKWKKKLGDNIGVYQLAIRDFMQPPSVSGIRFEYDSRSAVDKVLVRVWDDFHIASVAVAILDEDGMITEEGPAGYVPVTGYIYLLKRPSLLTVNHTVRVIVTDRPGNQVVEIFRGPVGIG